MIDEITALIENTINNVDWVFREKFAIVIMLQVLAIVLIVSNKK